MTNYFMQEMYRCDCEKKYLKSVSTKEGDIFGCLGSECEGVTFTQ